MKSVLWLLLGFIGCSLLGSLLLGLVHKMG